MPLAPLRGHDAVRRTIGAAIRAGELPQSLLLHGPQGIGKERLGLWIGQSLLCEAPGVEEPCGICHGCRLSVRLEHPDLHWFFPLPRPENASPEKLKEKLEDARAAELAARRADPFHVPSHDRAPAYFLAAIRRIQEIAFQRPSTGSRKVLVVGDAEAMVPQESSPEAANAFLKLLEEPPADTTVILTSSAPGALLATIRSRVLPVRMIPLPRETLVAFLREDRGADAVDIERIATLSRGSVGRALRLLPSKEGVGALERHREAGRALLRAAVAKSPAARFSAASAEAPAGGRGEFSDTLEALALWLRDLLAASAGAGEAIVNRAEAEGLVELARKHRIHPLAAGRAVERVYEALELASRNVNPQLIVSDLLRGIRADLLPTPEGS